MQNNCFLTITLKLTGHSISDGLVLRNMFSDRLENKLIKDSNGEWSGCGWFEDHGDIEFSHVKNIAQADIRILETLDDMGLDKNIVIITAQVEVDSDDESQS